MQKSQKIIGICGSYLYNQQPILIKKLHEEGRKHGYRLAALSFGTDSEEDTEDTYGDLELVSLIRHLPLSGMVMLTATIRNPSVIERIVTICNEFSIPIFSIDENLDGCYNFMLDNAGGFEQIVRHVVEFHGCRRINMLGGFKHEFFSDERINIYRKVLTEHNIPIEEERIGYGNFWDRPARQAVREFLNSSLPMPEAIICANDAMALAAYNVLRDAGYRVPEDIILTGFDGITAGQYHYPSLTTSEPNYDEVVSFIFHELETFHVQKSFMPCNRKITMKPLIKHTCGCMSKTVFDMAHITSTLYESAGDSAWHNISMNRLITANLHNTKITELSAILPNHLHMWTNHFRFACVKASMLSSYEVPDAFSDMVSILDVHSGQFAPTGEIFSIEEFIPHIQDLGDSEVLLIKLLNSGKTVYGYSVEGFHDIDERSMQRCNDFAFFLSYCLNTILHNGKQKELADGLRKANQEISIISLLDSLTGLYNRRGFSHTIELLLSKEQNIGKYLYIFSIDMNHLKYINDTFGHAEGDFAIATLANAIAKTAGEHAVCSRFGGDEFVVALLHDSDSAYSSDVFYQQMQDAVAATNDVSQKPYPIEASIGMTCQQLTSTTNVESMIATADAYMYQMKQKTRK